MGWKFWKQSQANTFPGTRPQDVVPPGAFALTIEDVFSITGRGTVVTGRVQAGSAAVGDQVVISRARQVLVQSQIDGIEMFKKSGLTVANAGDNVGLLLRGVSKDQVTRGDVIGK
ncbi:EF-Tu/IF-2/RF-3 family GTPase [Kribbella sp. NPDC056951]|uniref:EF-Tu/IF-2/RF-3 family GTPase n=1 Tax=Kribbella sp. NPDC056951 TaxID=3345978 RepID=UPI00363F2AF1